MTRWAMVADLRRCVGCQTCTAACKHANATPPGVQWRRVLDMEFGEFPDVQRAFVPVGCQHCEDPPCMEVCPSTATKKRAASWPSSSAPVNFQRTLGSRLAFSSQGRSSAILWLAATPSMALAWMTANRWPSRRWIVVTCWAGASLMK